MCVRVYVCVGGGGVRVGVRVCVGRGVFVWVCVRVASLNFAKHVGTSSLRREFLRSKSTFGTLQQLEIEHFLWPVPM